jgi:hypothetical protein
LLDTDPNPALLLYNKFTYSKHPTTHYNAHHSTHAKQATTLPARTLRSALVP